MSNPTHVLFDLPHLIIISIEGANALEFLQGQLTCDLREMKPNAARQGALCNTKGRIIALLDVIEFNGIKLIIRQDLWEKTCKILEKVAMLSRVRLQPISTWRVFGLRSPNSTDLMPTHSFHIDNDYYLVVVPGDEANHEHLCDAEAWHKARFLLKDFAIYPETSGLFLPHALNLQKTPRLSFNKGCYRGQEIIARMHYRGKLKHKLLCFKIESANIITPGSKIYNSETQQLIGEVIDYCQLDKHQALIATSILDSYPLTCNIDGQANPIKMNTY